LKTLADQCGVAIVVVHHLRKGSSNDPLEEVSGTTGLTGAADTIWTLKRDRGCMDATLFSTGRDIDEAETALRFDKSLGLWTLLGNADEYRTTHERHQVIEVLRQVGEPMRPKEIAEALGKTSGSVRILLTRLIDEGSIKKTGYGRYAITTNGSNGSNGSNSSNSSNTLEELQSVTGSNKPSVTLFQDEDQL
jgi:DNA-binding CsgD family transcriptional regulator